MGKQYVDFEIGKQKHIALVAHDGKKKEMVDWCDKNKDILKKSLSLRYRDDSQTDRGKNGASGARVQQRSPRRGSADWIKDRRRRH